MTHEELSELTSLVNRCLDSASLTVKRGRPIYMNEWVEQVNPVPSGHLRVLLSGTSRGFYQKIRVAPGKSGAIGRLLRRQSVATMNNAG